MAESNKVPTWKWLKQCSLEGFSVVVACVSVGNVPQLTGDLLISSLGMQRAATLYSPALVPVCGADPYSLTSNEICGPADVYFTTSGTKTAVIQIRSAIVRRHTSKFLNELVTSLKEALVTEIIILSSSFAHEKHQVMSSPFRYDTNDMFGRTMDPSWIKHEKVDDRLVIYGGGFATELLTICTEQSVPAMILFKYCSEGDNIPDAVECVGMLSQVLSLFPQDEGQTFESRIKQPVSWRLLFGGPPPREIY